MLRTINSKYFQHFDLLRGFLSLGLGFVTGKVSGSDSILTFGSRSRNVIQGSRSLAKSRIDHSIPPIVEDSAANKNTNKINILSYDTVAKKSQVLIMFHIRHKTLVRAKNGKIL